MSHLRLVGNKGVGNPADPEDFDSSMLEPPRWFVEHWLSLRTPSDFFSDILPTDIGKQFAFEQAFDAHLLNLAKSLSRERFAKPARAVASGADSSQQSREETPPDAFALLLVEAINSAVQPAWESYLSDAQEEEDAKGHWEE